METEAEASSEMALVSVLLHPRGGGSFCDLIV